MNDIQEQGDLFSLEGAGAGRDMCPTAATVRHPAPFSSFREFVNSLPSGCEMSTEEFQITNLIFQRGQQDGFYITIREIGEAIGLTDRDIKATVRRLRRELLLPVIASRRPPYGYRIARTIAEFEEWEKTFKGEMLDGLTTLYRLKRHNWPALVGQARIEIDLEVKN
jgi:hypothetical protein